MVITHMYLSPRFPTHACALILVKLQRQRLSCFSLHNLSILRAMVLLLSFIILKRHSMTEYFCVFVFTIKYVYCTFLVKSC